MTYSSEVLADSPLVYWRLGEASGTTATDASGNARHGTYSGTYTQGATSLLTSDSNTAVDFNGGKVAIASASWMDVGTAMTAEAWIKLTTKANYREFMSRYTNSGSRAWEFRIEITSGKAQFVKIAGGTTTCTGTTDLTDGNPHHVVATYDGSNIRLYVDGSLQTTTAASGSISGAGEFHIATRDAAFDLTFPGTIDEAAFYGTVLTGTRIAAHYAAGIASPNATVNAVAATATAAASAPTVTAASTVSPGAATATATAIPPAVTVPGDQTVEAPAATATAQAVPPSLAWNASVAAVAATATAQALAPTLGIGRTVTAVAATATATAIAPSVFNGSPDATVEAVAATATATALAPTVVQVLPAGTDTTNTANGRDRRARATVTITRPVAAVPATLTLATKVDKAIAYPAPVMVDGRPT